MPSTGILVSARPSARPPRAPRAGRGEPGDEGRVGEHVPDGPDLGRDGRGGAVRGGERRHGQGVMTMAVSTGGRRPRPRGRRRAAPRGTPSAGEPPGNSGGHRQRRRDDVGVLLGAPVNSGTPTARPSCLHARPGPADRGTREVEDDRVAGLDAGVLGDDAGSAAKSRLTECAAARRVEAARAVEGLADVLLVHPDVEAADAEQRTALVVSPNGPWTGSSAHSGPERGRATISSRSSSSSSTSSSSRPRRDSTNFSIRSPKAFRTWA